MNRRLGILAALALAFAVAHAQSDNVIHVKAYPGSDVGAKVKAAMLSCGASPVPCILVIDPSLASAPAGVMPSLCANCSLIDYRNGLPFLSASQTRSQTMAGPLTNANLGIFTGTAKNCVNQTQINGGTMSMWVAGGANGTQDGTCGMSIIPNTSTIWQSDGITGMVDNYTSGPPGGGGTAAVGGYFQARGYGNGSHIWGTNWAMIANAPNVTMQNEIDTDINDPSYTGAIIVGLNISAPFWNAAPLSAEGVKVYPSGGTSGAKWNAAFDSGQGASTVAFLAQASGVGNSLASQPMVFYNTDAGGVQRGSQINSDGTGSFQFVPYSSVSYFTGNISATGAVVGTAFQPSTSLALAGGTAMTANHGTGNSMQHSDGTGASHVAAFNAVGDTTDGGTGTAGKATCWKTTGTLGYCSTQPDATGACTCN